MTSPSPRPKLLRVLAGETISPPPVWLMRQAGRYLPEYRALRAQSRGFLDFCYTPERAAEATLQPVRRFDLDAAILFSDILVVPDGLGAQVEFREGEGPVLHPVSPADLARLDRGRMRNHLQPVYETVARVKAALPADKTLIGFAGAPWTVACYMAEGHGSRDFAAAKTWMWRDPASFATLIDILTEATVDHLSAQIEAGADCLQVFDSWAGVLPDREFQRYCIAPLRAIVTALATRHPGTPVIGFPRGAGSSLGPFAAETGVAAVSLDTAVPLDEGRKLQAQVAVQGNLDPILLLTGGAAMEARVSEILSTFGGGRHIFNLGHGVVPETPPEHVAALVRAVRER